MNSLRELAMYLFMVWFVLAIAAWPIYHTRIPLDLWLITCGIGLGVSACRSLKSGS